ncbi:MAG: carbohydrate porin [Phycisphaerales bacterium]|nr:carbohydrate porin [Phycisphaerales bacterium]
MHRTLSATLIATFAAISTTAGAADPPAAATSAPAPASPPSTASTDAKPAAPAPATPVAKMEAVPGFPDLDLPRVGGPDDDGFSVGEGPTSPIKELDEMESVRRSMLDLPFIERPLDDLTRGLNQLYAQTGLRLGFAYTMLFQQASGGPGDRYGGAGDIDFLGSWTLFGRETGNTGTLVVDGEYRFGIGSQPPSALRGELGLLTATTGGFNDRGWVLRDFHWRQRFFEGKLRFLVGRADVSDYAGGTRLQSINLFFSNRAFSANASTAFPNGHGPAAGVTIAPNDFFYVTAGAANALNSSNTINISSLDQGEFFYFAEVGITPEIPNLGAGRYRLFLWHMDERDQLGLPDDQGLSLILEQDFGDRLLAFLRYSYADASLNDIRNSVQAGVGIRGLLGSDANMTGAAFSFSEPASSDARDETVMEVFQRFQLTARTQFSLGAQLIVNPAYNPDQDVIGVFTARFRLAF